MTRWMPGPTHVHDGPVLVSITDFHANHRRELPSVAVEGMRMRMGWYAMPGAVGLWLWALPASSRSGSISVWAHEDDLERFINLPHHVGIMARYGPRGTVRSTKFHADRFDPQAVMLRARQWITDGS